MKQDPIFALIEAARKTNARETSVVKDGGLIEKALWARGITGKEHENHPDMKAHKRRWEAAYRLSAIAERKLFNTKPTTMEGFVAWLTYLEPLLTEWIAGQFDDGRSDRLFIKIVEAINGLPLTRTSRSSVIALKKAA
jgi:hypothetical protein